MTQPRINQTAPLIKANSGIPTLSNQQVQEICRLMVEEYGLGYSVMVESAGRTLVSLARRLVGGNLTDQHFTILVGAGNSGATGLVAARYIANAGAQVAVVLARPVSNLGPQAAHQYRLLLRTGQAAMIQAATSTMKLATVLRQSVLIIDALIGGGLHGWPTGAEAFLIQILGQTSQPVLALDLPSGLAPNGEPFNDPGLVVQATATLALALPRLAHTQPHNLAYLGDLYLADIGVPRNLYTRLGLTVGPLFSASDLILLRQPQNKTASP